MYFIDEEKVMLVTTCPSCGKGKILFPRKSCTSNCPAEKLEEEHKKIVYGMLSFVSLDTKIKVEFLDDEMIFGDDEQNMWDWAWINPIFRKMYIPWYALRSKWQFFNVIVHEIAHFFAYEKKYSIEERKILERVGSPLPNETEEEIIAENKGNEEIIRRYLREWKESKQSHWYDPWYLEYKNLFWKFYNSKFKKYTYGKIAEPLKYGFDKDGKGSYKEETVEYRK